MNSRRVKLLLSYDGTDYCGWQKQINAAKPSIQETLEGSLEKVFKEPVRCVASGRTDSGVHAMGQVVHFDAPKDPSRINFVRALEGILPSTIVVHASEIVPKDFHSLISAKAKTYRYRIWTHSTGPTFLRRFCHWYPYPFDFEKLQSLAQVLEGRHDFKSFESVGTEVPHTVRTIYRARWIQKRPHLVYFEVTGDGFLKQMVRNLVGTQLYYMQKKKSPKELKELLMLKDRTRAGYAAPSQGLVLVKVYY
jgi:tRNA pseudouridine38-40 synthase